MFLLGQPVCPFGKGGGSGWPGGDIKPMPFFLTRLLDDLVKNLHAYVEAPRSMKISLIFVVILRNDGFVKSSRCKARKN